MQQQFHEPQQETVTTKPRSVVESAECHTESLAPPATELSVSPLSKTILQSSKQARKWRRRKRRVIGVSALLFAASLALAALSFIMQPYYAYLLPYLGDAPNHVLQTLIISICLIVPASLVGVIAGILMRPTRRNAINTLWVTDNVQAIGPLLDATGMLMPDVKAQAIRALIPLLTRVRAKDVVSLTGPQQACLRRLLGVAPIDQPNDQALETEGIPKPQIETMQAEFQKTIDHVREFALAALHALTEIGTGQDVATVQRLASGNGLARNDPQVHAAARACLPILQARAEEERSSSTYLRAAEPPTACPDVLLRPATAATITDPQQLLRADDRQPYG
jgi:hypothetical protein